MRQDERHPCDAAESVASSMECTGLVPAITEGEDDQRELYAVTRAKRRGRKRDK